MPPCFQVPGLFPAHLTSDSSSGVMCCQVSRPLLPKSSGSSFRNKCAFAGYPAQMPSSQQPGFRRRNLNSNSRSTFSSPCDLEHFSLHLSVVYLSHQQKAATIPILEEGCQKSRQQHLKVKCLAQILCLMRHPLLLPFSASFSMLILILCWLQFNFLLIHKFVFFIRLRSL